MANEPYKSVSTFALPDAYQQQAAEARRRRRMAEMLAQQAYQPGDIQNAPIPAAAPLVQGLQAYLAARAGRKADEAEESARETASREARQLVRALTEEGDTTTNAVQPAMTPMAKTVTAPQFEDGRITAPASIEMVAPPPMTAPETQLSRYNLTPGQRRAAALEGMLASENPMVQKVAGAIYPTLAPKTPETKTMEFGGRLLNVTGGQATPVTIDGVAVTEPTKQKARTASEDFGGFIRTYYSDGTHKDEPKTLAPSRPTVVNTGSEPVVRIKGSDGKPIYVTRAQAIGKEPAPTNAQKMPGSIKIQIDERQTAAKQFGFGSKRSAYFRNLIETGSLPLSVVSNAQYAIERAADPTGKSKGPKGEKPAYVSYYELQRFVNQQVNTILQMAKGPQTEGDAIRARQQILDNPNNAAVVLSALEDLENIFKEEQKNLLESANFLSEDYENSSSNKVEEVDY